ncbi:hypothetical protein [Nocardioides daejeonensis]|uniref:hypothetical protein n=1 Tax=Nocardioides daejeonensis TaxID=1046556 RepID=UPI000D7473FD|nr:hypothetical protein [Nocardioides daejeonensis]
MRPKTRPWPIRADDPVAVGTGGRTDAATSMRIALFLSGLVGPLLNSRCADVSDDDLRAGIIDAGRLLLA